MASCAPAAACYGEDLGFRVQCFTRKVMNALFSVDLADLVIYKKGPSSKHESQILLHKNPICGICSTVGFS